MRISKIALFLALFVVAVAAPLFFLSHRSNPIEYKLADGSILRLEKVSYGKRDKFMPREGWLRRLNDELLAHLPAKLANRFINPSRSSSSWWNNSVVHSNLDALHIWITRRDPVTGNYLDVKMNSAQLVDEHGCAFIATQCGGDNNGTVTNGYCVGWFTFEAFPRHERSFRLEFPDTSVTNLCTFTVANPAPPPKEVSDWMVKPLPITNQDGDVTFVLNKINVTTNFTDAGTVHYGNRWQIAPAFEVTEPFQPTREWEAVDVDLYDSAGNFASELWGDSRFLCPEEKAWKLAVRFFGSEKSASASNSVWTLHGLKVPAPGEFTNLNATKDVQGVMLTAISLAGAGNVTYSNNVAVQASPLSDSNHNNSFNSSSGGMNVNSYNLTANTPHIAMLIPKLPDDQRLTIRATDDRGREFYAHEWSWGSYQGHSAKVGELHYLKLYDSNGLTFLTLDLADDSKTIDLTFCIHKARTAEFIFKPPTDGAQFASGKQP
jgi:hypothetical protein